MQVKLLLQADKLEGMMKMGRSIPSIGFSTTTLDRIVDKDSIAGLDFLNFAKIVNNFLSKAKTCKSNHRISR